MNTAINYIRVSTLKQADGISLEAQSSLLKKYAELNGYDNVIEIQDILSGKNVNRPGFQEMMQLVEKKKVNAIFVYSLSRFGRNVVDVIQNISLLNKSHVEFYSYSEKIDTSSANGKFFLTLLSALAELEKNIISERTKMALNCKREKSEKIGSVPYGCDCFDGKNLTENAEERATLNLMRELRIQKCSYSEIVTRLTKAGRKNKRGQVRWHKSQVIRLLKKI